MRFGYVYKRRQKGGNSRPIHSIAVHDYLVSREKHESAWFISAKSCTCRCVCVAFRAPSNAREGILQFKKNQLIMKRRALSELYAPHVPLVSGTPLHPNVATG